MTDLSWLLLETVIVLAFTQAFIWLNNARYRGPKGELKTQKILSLLKLEEYGFRAGLKSLGGDENGQKIRTGYEGEIEGYPVEILFEPSTGWLKHPHYTVRACLNIWIGDAPDEAGKTKRNSEAVGQDESRIQNWVERRIAIGKFGHLSGEQLIGIARELIRGVRN